MRSPAKPFVRFALAVLALVPLLLALWWFVALDPALQALLVVMDWLVPALFPGKIIALQAAGHEWLALTSLSIPDAPWGIVGIKIHAPSFTVGLPLLWALVLATPHSRRLRNLFLGTALVLPTMVLAMLVFIQTAWIYHVNQSPELTEELYVLANPYPEYVHRLAMLVDRPLRLLLVNVAPMLIWAGLNRDVLTRQPRLRGERA